MAQPTVLDVPAEVCRVILDAGTVVFEDDQLIVLEYQGWVELEPRLESTTGNWRRAISPFNRKFLFWVAYAEKAGDGVQPVQTWLYPFH